MGSFYNDSNQVAVLRERITELARIRQGFATHLGASLYEATKDNEALRWGRESLYDGIAMCDNERQRLLAKIADLEQKAVAPSYVPMPAPEEVVQENVPVVAPREDFVEETPSKAVVDAP